VFQRLIDRVRGPLQVQTICTLFGRRQRPRRQKGQPQEPTVEAVLKRPEYDLIIFRVHFGRCTLKIYTKGERVLRIEAMAHNTRDLRCGTAIVRFPAIVAALRGMVERFIEVIDCVNGTFVEGGVLDDLPRPTRLGQARVGGIDLNLRRMRAVIEGSAWLRSPMASRVPNSASASRQVCLPRLTPRSRPPTICASFGARPLSPDCRTRIGIGLALPRSEACTHSC
jgi:hypothetical protein